MSRIAKAFLTAAAAALLAAVPAWADEAAPKPDAAKVDAPKAKPMVKKNMKMQEPMGGEMKKEGMMKGDMKKAADKKDSQMKEPMQLEEKKMK